MWVLERFGLKLPTTAKYPFLKPFDNAGNLRPKSAGYNQIRWDQAWEWYDEYKKGTISFLEYRIQIREKELEEMEEYLKQIKAREKFSRDAKYLLKSYEQKIPLRKKEISKLKTELELLKTKEMQRKQEKESDLSLENENLQLKKQILEMELKLKNFNKER